MKLAIDLGIVWQSYEDDKMTWGTSTLSLKKSAHSKNNYVWQSIFWQNSVIVLKINYVGIKLKCSKSTNFGVINFSTTFCSCFPDVNELWVSCKGDV